jgi:hypothetical protein
MKIHHRNNRRIAIRALIAVFMAIDITSDRFSGARVTHDATGLPTLAFIVEPGVKLLHHFQFNNAVILQALNLLSCLHI